MLVLMATLVGAAVFAPDFVRLVRPGKFDPRVTHRPVKTQRPIVRHQWRFDFSMGPILELIEQGLNLDPFDLRRPLRIPFSVRSRPGGDILLTGPGSYLPPLVPSNGSPLGALPPEGSGGGPTLLPPLPGLNAGGGGLPDGQPDFDPDLTVSDDPLAPPGNPPGDVPEPQSEDPPNVPEPGVLWLIGTGLGALALRRRSPR